MGKKSVLTPQTFEQMKEAFKKEFKALGHLRWSYDQIWRDFAEIAALFSHQMCYFNPRVMHPSAASFLLPIDVQYERLEEQYVSVAQKYRGEPMKCLIRLCMLTFEAIEAHRRDFLGAVYEELEIVSRGHQSASGEFLTPWAVSYASAKMLLVGVQAIVEQKGYLTLLEPACGAGVMPMAAATVLEEMGYEPQRMTLMTCIDVNKTMVHMTYVQLSSLGIPARVYHGNTLKMEYWECFETPQLKLSRHAWEKDPAFRLLRIMRELEGNRGESGGRESSTRRGEPVSREHAVERLVAATPLAEGQEVPPPEIPDEKESDEQIELPGYPEDTDRRGQMRLF